MTGIGQAFGLVLIVVVLWWINRRVGRGQPPLNPFYRSRGKR